MKGAKLSSINTLFYKTSKKHHLWSWIFNIPDIFPAWNNKDLTLKMLRKPHLHGKLPLVICVFLQYICQAAVWRFGLRIYSSFWSFSRNRDYFNVLMSSFLPVHPLPYKTFIELCYPVQESTSSLDTLTSSTSWVCCLLLPLYGSMTWDLNCLSWSVGV